MKLYGIANTQGVGLNIRLGEGLPDLLGLGHREEIVLPVFSGEVRLRTFVSAHHALKAAGTEAFEPTLLGNTYFEVAEKISAVVEASEVELIVFDPLVNMNGWWVNGAFEWPAEKFCDFFTTVLPAVEDVARKREGIPSDRQPSPEALDKALDWYMCRMMAYVHGPSRSYSELK